MVVWYRYITIPFIQWYSVGFSALVDKQRRKFLRLRLRFRLRLRLQRPALCSTMLQVVQQAVVNEGEAIGVYLDLLTS